jgi:hypothetical protein
MPDFATFTAYLRALFVSLYPTIASEEWKGWTPEQVKSLNTLMHLIDDIYNGKLRPPYDQTFYRLAKETKVVTGLEPVRKETVRKDGKSEQPSADALFDSLIGSVQTETTTE